MKNTVVVAVVLVPALVAWGCAVDTPDEAAPAPGMNDSSGSSATPAETHPGDTGADGLHFVEVAADAGLNFRHQAGKADDKRAIYESNAAGLGWIDHDGDGLMDLYLAQSGGRLRSEPPPADEVTSGALFRNQGDGTFVDVTRTAGLADWRWGMGVAVADYDNDGDSDLYVTHVGTNALWQNAGDGTFTDVAAAAGVADPGPGSGAAFGDIDGDGYLNLYVANYVTVNADMPLPETEDLCTYRGVSVYCGPKGLPVAPDSLFRNRGDGTFEDVTATAGVGAAVPRHSFDALFLDVDVDGDQDIYVAADAGPSMLFIGDGTGRFTERGMYAGVALAEAGTAQAGMGVDVSDWNADGLPDIAKTNFEGEVFNLYVNSPTGLFADRAYAAGLGSTMPALGWGVVFFDADRDGWLDLFFANGHVYPLVESTTLQLEYAQRNLLFRTRRDEQGNLSLIDVSRHAGPGLATRKVSRGVALADYDGDGDLDLAINNSDDAPDLLRNDSQVAGHWLVVRTVGTVSNRDGYGARVSLRAGELRQVRQVRASRGFLSSSDPALHFGLGGSSVVDELEVRWPSGRIEFFLVPAVDRAVTVTEGTGNPR